MDAVTAAVAPEAVTNAPTAAPMDAGDRYPMPYVQRMSSEQTPRLRQQRDFQLLWFGQLVSALGSRVTGIALTLLVLAETDSPAKAGLAAFAFGLPLLGFTLPAGAFIDRWNRRAVMLAADSTRLLALGSLAIALLAGVFSLGHVLAVAFVEGAGYTFFAVAERAALRHLVPRELLPAATAQNQVRESIALAAASRSAASCSRSGASSRSPSTRSPTWSR